jgi:hypothetical protein
VESIVQHVVNYLVQVTMASIAQLLVLLGPCVLLCIGMSVIASWVRNLACQCFGLHTYLALFGWLGTSIHELGHVVFLLLFRHRIVELKLFAPDAKSGTLGYVRSRYDPRNLYQRIGIFFVGIGPILFGSFVIYLLYWWLVGSQQHVVLSLENTGASLSATLSAFGQQLFEIVKTILASLFRFENLTDWRFYLFAYITFAIGTSISLSSSDIEGAITGFVTLTIALFVFNVATIWIGDFAGSYLLAVSQFFGFFYALVVCLILMNLLVGSLLYLLTRLRYL